MKKTALVLAMAVMLTLTACKKELPPVPMVQQCGYDANNERICMMVPASQVQQQSYQQPAQVAPQYSQPAPQYVQPAQPVIVQNGSSGAGDAMVGVAAGMMIGSALSNSGGSRYDSRYGNDRTYVEKKTIVNNKTVYVNQAPAHTAPTPLPAQPAVAPRPNQTLASIPAQRPVAPAPMPPAARPMIVSPPPSASRPSTPAPRSFTSSSSSSSSNGFKRK